MMRWICMIGNAILFAAILIHSAVSPEIGPPGRREELTFYILLALLFACVAAGLLTRKRWLVIVPSLPVILAGILLALFMLTGGWIRGPVTASTVSLFIIAGLGVALLEVAAIVTARKVQQPDAARAAPPPA